MEKEEVKERQEVIFETTATENPWEAVESARYIVNVLSSQEEKVLGEIIRKVLPTVKGALTEKTIIRTDRYKCPCCDYGMDLSVLVKVRCPGTRPWECKEVEGLYSIVISPGSGQQRVVAEKLSGTVIYQG
ncbi:MAG: hypothetical protein GXP44_00515 [bacterium]|nr:hypothetical protein [bacterium]